MAVKRIGVKKKIYSWPVVSSTERDGMLAKYTVFLYQDNSMSCDCPGWVFHHRKSGDCRHIKHVRNEATNLYNLFKSGKPLPSVRGEAGAVEPKPSKSEEDIPFGRFVEY